jgi:hypothetical protein
MLLTTDVRSLPGFTAEAAGGRRGRYAARALARPDDAASIVPQDDYGWCTCPCCMTVSCGWLGLSTCIQCCDAPPAAAVAR